MSHDVQVTFCSEKEIYLLQQFIDQYWKQGHILSYDQKLLLWQYSQQRSYIKPLNGPSVLIARDNKDNLVGMLGLINVEVNVQGKLYPGVWLAIWLSIPEAKRLGAGLKLLWSVHKMGYQAIFVVGSNEMVNRVYEGLNYWIYRDMPRWIGILDMKKTKLLLEIANAQADKNSITRLVEEHSVSPKFKVPGDFDIEIIKPNRPLGQDWDDFWYETLAPFMICTNRDSKYLNWRYCEHPRFRYEMLMAKDRRTKKPLGLIVFRLEQIKGYNDRVIRVVDFLSVPQAEFALARAFVSAAQENNVLFADFYCTDSRAVHALEALGFKLFKWHEGQPYFPCRFQPLEGTPFKLNGAFWLSPEIGNTKTLANAEGFYVTKSDGDQDRPN